MSSILLLLVYHAGTSFNFLEVELGPTQPFVLVLLFLSGCDFWHAGFRIYPLAICFNSNIIFSGRPYVNIYIKYSSFPQAICHLSIMALKKLSCLCIALYCILTVRIVNV
jgi:hypothetical protein